MIRTAVPSQYSGGLSVAALTVSKGLKAWKFHLDPDIILQTSSNKKYLIFRWLRSGQQDILNIFSDSRKPTES